MSDPVAEAAAQLAQQSEPTMLERAMDTIHELEAKVEHLIHPDAPGNAPVVAEASVTAPATAVEAELPNAALAAADATAAPVSAPSADGVSTTSPTVESSVEPLHVRIAAHLEAIFQMAKETTAPATAADTSALKTHVGDVLHRISNGMAVSEGELVSKLEALYHML